MKIGFISGDLVEVSNTRAAVSVPDYPVQGRLMWLWRQAGHEVVLLTRHPTGDELPEGVVVDAGGDVDAHGLDVLFGDRLGPYGSEWLLTLRQLEHYHGPVVFHQYVPYSRWAPPFADMPHLLGAERRWMVLNRSVDPFTAYNTVTGMNERVSAYGHVRFERWEPFYMLDYPWGHEYALDTTVGQRPALQGYYGRVPRGEIRARTVKRWLQVGEWDRIVYGPETSSSWLAEVTGAENGGRVLHRDLPQALTTFNVIVQASIDRLRNKGALDYWPHRVVECALAGVLQLFDIEMGLKSFERWQVVRPSDLLRWVDAIRDPAVLQEQVRLQQELVLPRADPVEVHRRLMTLIEDHAS